MIRPTSPRSTPTDREEPFEDRLETLIEELSFAIQNGRPSILLAPYASEYTRAEVELELERRLAAAGQRLNRVHATPDKFDLPLLLTRHPDRQTSVFSVRGLSEGGGRAKANAYRALNIRRELLVDRPVRSVFWLTRKESVGLSRHAPDFWAFRHRVVEFDRPEDLERLASLVETGTGVKRLYFATVRQELRAAKRAAKLAPDSAVAGEGLADLLLTLGLCEEGRPLCRKLTGLNPGDAEAWYRLGRCSQFPAAFFEAIPALEKCVELEPEHLKARLSLSACHLALEERMLAAEQLRLCQPLLENATSEELGSFEGLSGNAEKAVERLKSAMEKDGRTRLKLCAEPNLEAIRDNPLFQRLLMELP